MYKSNDPFWVGVLGALLGSTITMAFLQVTGIADISWWTILAPVWVPALAVTLVLLAVTATLIRESRTQDAAEMANDRLEQLEQRKGES